MTYETHSLHTTGSISFTNGWTATIASWFRAWRDGYARNREIRHLLTYDKHLLKDIGLSRSELVGELGYDPCESLGLFGAGAYPNPYLRVGHGMNSNHADRHG